jgi:C-terminal processing protease CtpA/Prc
MMALLGEWSGLTVTELAQRGDIGRFGVAGALALQLMNSGQISPQQAAGMADEFLSGDQRVGVVARSAEKLAPTDPTAALAMGEGLTDWQQVRFLSRFVSGWATAEPDAARAWAMQVEDPRTRARLVGRVLAEQVKSDPVGAAQTFAQMPPGDAEVRQRTARQIASQWAANDTLSAMQWSDSLSDEGDRDAARQGIRSAAPVGIGARLSTGNDGVPVLDSIVPGSPASASGQLQSGDRVLAVADANGGWVNSRNRPLGDVVRLIQGEPNTQVTLQVQSADGSAPRVVTLGREQIIFRPGS